METPGVRTEGSNSASKKGGEGSNSASKMGSTSAAKSQPKTKKDKWAEIEKKVDGHAHAEVDVESERALYCARLRREEGVQPH